MSINIIPTTAAEHIASRLIGKAGLQVIFPEKNKDGKRYFPDGEVYAKISLANELTGRTVILHTGAPNPNNGIVELEMLLDIVEGSRADKTEVFFTYFPYGMQDKVFEKGETNAAENLIKKLIDYYGVGRIYTIDAHFAGGDWVNKYPITNVSAVDLLVQAATRDYPEIVYLAPDIGSQRRTGLKGTEKQRKDSYTTEIYSDEEFKAAVQNKAVGAVDDLLETGGTMERFYDECVRCGAKEMVALVTHGVLIEGIERIQKKYARLYLTNTIDRAEANIDITDTVLAALVGHAV